MPTTSRALLHDVLGEAARLAADFGPRHRDQVDVSGEAAMNGQRVDAGEREK